MIHVDLAPEPRDFDEKVRRPGLAALAEGRDPLPPLWRACLRDLHERYRGICAYLCVFIPRGTGTPSVDHAAPKSKRHDLAFEWSNYRLVSLLMNARKRDFDDVLDPFEIPDGWFVLELSFLQVMPSPDLDAATRERVEATIDRLRLNDQECLAARALYFDLFLEGEISTKVLQEMSPFVAREVLRGTPSTPSPGTRAAR